MTTALSDGEFEEWLNVVCKEYHCLSDDRKTQTLDRLIFSSGPEQLIHLSGLLPQLLFRDFVSMLPPEVTYHILKYLPVKSLLSCSMVSRSWNCVVQRSARVWWQKAMHCGATDVSYHSSSRAVHKYRTLSLQLLQFIASFSLRSCFLETLLPGHDNRVMAICYHDGKIATGSDDQSVRIWDAHAGKTLYKIHTHTVCDIKLTSRYVYTASFDGTAACWEISSGEQRHRFVGHTSAIFSIDVHSSGIVITGSSDKSVKIWHFENYEPDLLASLEEYHSEWITKVQFLKFSDPSNDFIFASVDKNIGHIWSCDISGHYKRLYSTQRTSGVQITSFTHNQPNTFHLCTWKEKELCNVLCMYSCSRQSLTLMWTVSLGGDMPLRCQLLGAGRRFALLTSSSEINQLFVFNFCQDRCVAKVHIPLCRSTRNGATLALGDVSWLDGLDGAPPGGTLITACLQNSSQVLLLNWKHGCHTSAKCRRVAQQ